MGNRLLFHLLGFLALSAVHFAADYYHFQQRGGFYKYSPYLFLILLYGWIVFHNLVLFDGLYLSGRKRAYFSWTSLAMLICSLNMFFILYSGFGISNPLIHILNFWIYTLLGLGVYMTFRYVKESSNKTITKVPVTNADQKQIESANFTFTADGEWHSLPLETIIYLESLENYIKVHTLQKTYLVRLTLKETEQRLPIPLFIRISRSHILNTSYITGFDKAFINMGEQQFKIGNVYKKYVEEQLVALKEYIRVSN